jgi:hypothetical protein
MLRMAIKDACWQLPLRACNVRKNARCCGRERILIVQNSVKQRAIARDYFTWIERYVPSLFQRLEFALLPCHAPHPERHRLVVFLGGDTLLDHAPWAYQQAVRLSEQCAKANVPVINPAPSWQVVAKSETARILATAGIRTPRVEPITDVAAFLQRPQDWPLPLLIREDRCHGQQSHFIQSWDDLHRVPWKTFRRPVAVEFIDTRSPVDGLFRKRRYIAFDGTGNPQHLIFHNAWEVRETKIKTEATRAEECAHLDRADANHDLLQHARKVLGLNQVAFDYAYDHSGRVVVWEANPFPDVNYRLDHWSWHSRTAQERTFAMLARGYLRRAGWSVPPLLDDLLADMSDDDRGVNWRPHLDVSGAAPATAAAM